MAIAIFSTADQFFVCIHFPPSFQTFRYIYLLLFIYSCSFFTCIYVINVNNNPLVDLPIKLTFFFFLLKEAIQFGKNSTILMNL